MPRYTALVPARLAVYVDAPDEQSAAILIVEAEEEAEANPKWDNGVWGTALSIDGRFEGLRLAEPSEGS